MRPSQISHNVAGACNSWRKENVKGCFAFPNILVSSPDLRCNCRNAAEMIALSMRGSEKLYSGESEAPSRIILTSLKETSAFASGKMRTSPPMFLEVFSGVKVRWNETLSKSTLGGEDVFLVKCLTKHQVRLGRIDRCLLYIKGKGEIKNKTKQKKNAKNWSKLKTDLTFGDISLYNLMRNVRCVLSFE